MARPGDWHVLDLAHDPTPGDPWGIRDLSRRWDRLADDAADAESSVRALLGDGALVSWVGEAADVITPAIGELPEQLGRCAESYRSGARALGTWADDLESAQSDADRALVRGREARQRLESLEGQLADAEQLARAADATATATALTADGPGPDAPAPDPAQVATAVRSAQRAQERARSLDASAGDARAELDLARRLALEAGALREDRGRVAAARVREAATEGVQPRSWWDRFKEAAAAGWKVLVQVASVVVVVLAVFALIIGGPIAWVVFAAGVVLMVDALVKYASGEGSVWDLGLAALGMIPGARGLTTLGAVRGAFRSGGLLSAGGHVLSAGRTAVLDMAGAVRGLGAGAVSWIRGLGPVLSDVSGGLRRLDDGAARLERGSETAAHNPFLGPLELPEDPRILPLLDGYDRYAGLTPQEFVARFADPADPSRANWALVPDDGFAGERVAIQLRPGEVLDRFGPETGAYLSPDGTPYAQRAIPPGNLAPLRLPGGELVSPYFRYEVLKPFDAQVGYVAEAFGQPGDGLQILLDPALLHQLPTGDERLSVQVLVGLGYLRPLP